MFSLTELLFVFVLGSFVGWMIEMPFRTIRNKRTFNPGLLNGPYIPIYGFGFIILVFLSSIEMNIFLKIILFGISATFLELITGIIFIKFFKVKLWDYTDMKFNYKGIICPLFSILWTVLSVGFFLLAYPVILLMFGFIQGNVFVHFGLGIFYGVFIIDCFISLSLITRIRSIVIEIDKKRKTGMLVDYKKLKIDISFYLKNVKHINFIKRFFLTINNRLIELPKHIKKVINKK